jgi:hypothetical protein
MVARLLIAVLVVVMRRRVWLIEGGSHQIYRKSFGVFVFQLSPITTDSSVDLPKSRHASFNGENPKPPRLECSWLAGNFQCST